MTYRFELPEEFNVCTAQDTLEGLRLWLAHTVQDRTQTIEISAQNVAEIDNTGMQLIAALTRSGLTWRISDSSLKFTEACETLGLQHWISHLDASASAQQVAS